MRLSFGQELRMTQKQVLAPRMIQSMEILQLPIMALQERIDQEMEENPVLDLSEMNGEMDEESSSDAEEHPDSPAEGEKELVVDESSNSEDDFERLMNMDEEFPDTFDERPQLSRNAIDEESDRKHDAMANMAARSETLHDYLIHQLSWFEVDPAVRTMAERIIYSLDSNGYLKSPLSELIDTDGGQQQLETAEKALQLVQRLDPPGVGARNLRECFLLQLTPGMPCYEQIHSLVSDHLEDLANNRLPAIERTTGFSIDEIKAAWDELKKLNPKPGAEFSESTVPNVTPDVFIEPDEGGGYRVRLEDGQTPQLYISKYYRELFRKSAANSETREYIKRKINSAQWLIDSIEQRRSTLTRVSQAIVDHQQEFIEKGPDFIHPLKMQQIADKVGVHVTTVSRAVDDKWIQTPRGIFPLKRFFVGGTVSADGEEVAWDAVRTKLQEIIDEEDKSKPYSDDELVNQLARHAITVARRTVTKYRKAMNIPSSRQRKDWSKVESK